MITHERGLKKLHETYLLIFDDRIKTIHELHEKNTRVEQRNFVE